MQAFLSAIVIITLVSIAANSLGSLWLLYKITKEGLRQAKANDAEAEEQRTPRKSLQPKAVVVSSELLG